MSTMTEAPLRAEYFVTRSNATMVPLIAVDELPHHINILGVSRIMTPLDIVGMTCVGQSNLRHRRYIVQDAPELATPNLVHGSDFLTAKHFIIRESGNMVPLVAMDEMPAAFVINTVPRTISAFEIIGMTCAGSGPIRNSFYTVEDVNRTAVSLSSLGMSTNQQEDRAVMVSTNAPSPTPSRAMSPAPTQQGDALTKQEILDAFANGERVNSVQSDTTSVFHDSRSQVQSSPSTAATDIGEPKFILSRSPSAKKTATSSFADFVPGRKKYCSYWIRHGECDYQQQGCMYLHEMPTDPEGLDRLGLRDIPKWFREKHRYFSYLAEDGAGAGPGGEGLTKAAATETFQHEKDRLMERDWRLLQSPGRNPVPMLAAGRRNGNTYNPRSSRFAMNPNSFSRGPLGQSSGALFIGGNRKRDPVLESRSSLGASKFAPLSSQNTRRPALGNKDKGVANAEDADISNSDAASVVSGGTKSISAYTDIEAQVGREDRERKAREDAAYQRILDSENSNGGSGTKELVSFSAMMNGNNLNMSGAKVRRGGRGGNGKVKARKPAAAAATKTDSGSGSGGKQVNAGQTKPAEGSTAKAAPAVSNQGEDIAKAVVGSSGDGSNSEVANAKTA